MKPQMVTQSYQDSYQEFLKVQNEVVECYDKIRLNYNEMEKVGTVIDYLTANNLLVPDKVVQNLDEIRKVSDQTNDEYDRLLAKEDYLRRVVGDYRNLKHVLIMLMQECGLTYEKLSEIIQVKKEKLLGLDTSKHRLTLSELKRICDFFELNPDLYKKHVMLR